MKVFYSFDQLPVCEEPLGIAIGNFDGVHIGHQQIFDKIRSVIGPQGIVFAITFRNHPAEFFRKGQKFPYLCTFEEKLKRLEQAGVDMVLALHFDEKIAALSYTEFLDKIRKYLPFEVLVRGKGSVLGKNREGTQEAIETYAQQHKCRALYIDLVLQDNTPIHSSQIRSFIQKGNFENAKIRLGRAYSIQGKNAKITQKTDGKEISFEISDICLPDPGSYPCLLEQNSQKTPGMLIIASELKFLSSELESFDRNTPFLINFL